MENDTASFRSMHPDMEKAAVWFTNGKVNGHRELERGLIAERPWSSLNRKVLLNTRAMERQD